MQQNSTREQAELSTTIQPEQQEPIVLPPLEDPAREIEDPIATALAKSWQQILGGIACVFAIWWGYTLYIDANRTRLESAADVYRSVREDYATLIEQQQKLVAEQDAQKKGELSTQLESTKKKLTEKIRVLRDQPEPYANVATLYESFAALRSGDRSPAGMTDALAALSRVPADNAQRLFAELHALVEIRARLDGDDRSQARAALKSLAQEGVFVAPTAGITLYRSANESERAEALDILTALKAKFPESAETIARETKS
jgi:hypothetical protein